MSETSVGSSLLILASQCFSYLLPPHASKTVTCSLSASPDHSWQNKRRHPSPKKGVGGTRALALLIYTYIYMGPGQLEFDAEDASRRHIASQNHNKSSKTAFQTQWVHPPTNKEINETWGLDALAVKVDNGEIALSQGLCRRSSWARSTSLSGSIVASGLACRYSAQSHPSGSLTQSPTAPDLGDRSAHKTPGTRARGHTHDENGPK